MSLESKETILETLARLDGKIKALKDVQDDIKLDLLKHAKYRVNDKVVVKEWSFDKVTKKGIIISMSVVLDDDDRGYIIKYKVSKAKKDGTAHATAMLGWRGIKESNIISKFT